MKKTSGILMLLVYVFVATMLLNANFVGAENMANLVRWSSFSAILGIGAVFVIITGGIDLSIGSVVGLVGCLLPMVLKAMLESCCIRQTSSAVVPDIRTKMRLAAAANATIRPMDMPTRISTRDRPCWRA